MPRSSRERAPEAPGPSSDDPPSADFAARCRREGVPPRLQRPLWELLKRWRGPGTEGQAVERVIEDYREWALYRRSREGDQKAAAELERRWRPLATALLSRRVAPTEVADLTSAFFARLYRAREVEFAWRSPFGVYLRTVLLNLARDAHRSRAVRARREAPLPEPGEAGEPVATAASPLDALLAREHGSRVLQAFARLAADEQRLLTACLIEGRPAAEVARELGLDRQAVYQRIYRARRRFRALLLRAGVPVE